MNNEPDVGHMVIHPILREIVSKRMQLKHMRKMALDIAEHTPTPVVLATIETIEVELLYLKLQLNAIY